MVTEPAPAIDPRELVERLALRDDGVTNEVYAIVKHAIAEDEKRDGGLTQKAMALLSAAGLSLTIAFTFGGFLLQKPEQIIALGHSRWVIVGAYAAEVVLGLLASLWALLALKVRDGYRGIDPHEVFGSVLTQADGARSATQYKRHLIAHLWRVYERNFATHDKKAALVKRGQTAFFWFIVALLLIGGTMTYAIAQAPTDTGGRSTATQPAPALPPAAAQPAAAPASSNAPPPPATAAPASPSSLAAPPTPPAALPVPSAGRSMTASQQPPPAPRGISRP